MRDNSSIRADKVMSSLAGGVDTGPIIRTNGSVLREHLEPGALNILDVGSGSGQLV